MTDLAQGHLFLHTHLEHRAVQEQTRPHGGRTSFAPWSRRMPELGVTCGRSIALKNARMAAELTPLRNSYDRPIASRSVDTFTCNQHHH